jgi:hypothetical protein
VAQVVVRFWDARTAILVCGHMEGWAMGDVCTLLPLYLGMGMWYLELLDKKSVKIVAKIIKRIGRFFVEVYILAWFWLADLIMGRDE